MWNKKMSCYDNMYNDTILNNLHTSGVSSLPAFSLANSGSRAVPRAGSLMYNLDDSLVYLSQGPDRGWITAGATTSAIHVTDTTQSTSCDTGSITTDGGFGIAKNLYSCGTLAVAQGSTLSGQVGILSTTASSSPTTGALVVNGGVGIGGNLNVVGPVRATRLATTGAAVVVGSSNPPTVGEVLIANSSTSASWQFIDASSLSGVLPVANGGTGDSTLTLGDVLVGNGTDPIITNKAAPIGDFVGITDTQSLINKTITYDTNLVQATQLATTGADVVVSEAPQSVLGQILVATSPTTAAWQFAGASGPVTQLATSGTPVTINSTAPGASNSGTGYMLVSSDTTDAVWVDTSNSSNYTPIITNSVGGIGASVYSGNTFPPTPYWLYSRSGNVVAVIGMLGILQVNPGTGSFWVSLPIARLTAFSQLYQASGFIYPAYPNYDASSEYGSYITAVVGQTSNVIVTASTQNFGLNGQFTCSFMYTLT